MLSSLSWKIWLREYQRQLINNNNSVRSCLVPAMFNLWRHWMTHLYFTFIRSKYVKDGGIWQALLFWEKKNCDTIHSYHSWKRRLAEYTTPWVNFINILSFFCTKVLRTDFLCLHFGFVTFCRKNIGEKSASKMLMKLTPWCLTPCNWRIFFPNLELLLSTVEVM